MLTSSSANLKDDVEISKAATLLWSVDLLCMLSPMSDATLLHTFLAHTSLIPLVVQPSRPAQPGPQMTCEGRGVESPHTLHTLGEFVQITEFNKLNDF